MDLVAIEAHWDNFCSYTGMNSVAKGKPLSIALLSQ